MMTAWYRFVAAMVGQDSRPRIRGLGAWLLIDRKGPTTCVNDVVEYPDEICILEFMRKMEIRREYSTSDKKLDELCFGI